MAIVVSGPATTIFNRAEQTGPRPATGTHAEQLAEISQGASALNKLVELERSGVYDSGKAFGSARIQC
jgi:hypothetical protein